MSEAKPCPMAFIGLTFIDGQTLGPFALCVQEKCAWWVEAAMAAGAAVAAAWAAGASGTAWAARAARKKIKSACHRFVLAQLRGKAKE